MRVRVLAVLLIVSVCASSTSEANFGGFEEQDAGMGITILNVKKNNRIRLTKERLEFRLGQRVEFAGKFWFQNADKGRQVISVGFPQYVDWPLSFDKKGVPSVLAGKPPKLNSTVMIDGKPVTVREMFTACDENGDFAKGQELLSLEQLQKRVGSRIKNTDLKSCRMVIWNVFEMNMQVGVTVEADIAFVRPWSYLDMYVSDTLESNGLRYFEYITSTARTWANGDVEDFEARVIAPEDSAENIHLFPNGWKNDGKGSWLLSRKNWAPLGKDHLVFAWLSDYEMPKNPDALEDEKTCSNYYGDYSWRFLTDGSRQTAWCIPQDGQKCPIYRLLRIDTSEQDAPYLFPWMEELKKSYFVGIKRPVHLPATANYLEITTGYAKNRDLFIANGRPKELEITFCKSHVKAVFGYEDTISAIRNCSKPENLRRQTVNLADISTPQVIKLDKPIDRDFNLLGFRIREIYPGKKSTDVCVSDLRLIP